ncbi:drebrin-like isoform X1, partial [Silurus meridionalis]
MNKFSQAAGVNYRMQNESCPLPNTAASHLVGSVYHKTSALEEIKGTERENFWAQIQECKKTEEERQRVEKERKEQEEMAGRVREQRVRDKQINQQ